MKNYLIAKPVNSGLLLVLKYAIQAQCQLITNINGYTPAGAQSQSDPF